MINELNYSQFKNFMNFIFSVLCYVSHNERHPCPISGYSKKVSGTLGY